MEKNLRLEDVAKLLEEEARMILPGIQALFGFQLVAVFNNRFETLIFRDQLLHFLALICTSLAILLVLVPAAYHRRVEPYKVSTYFCNLGSKLLTLSLLPMLIGTSLDIFVISDMIFKNVHLSLAVSSAMFAILIYAWFLFPMWRRRHAPLA